MDDQKRKTQGAAEGDGEMESTPAGDVGRAPAGSGTPGASSSVDSEVVQAFEQELAEASRRADENWDRYLRAEADLENLRRAAERRRAEAVDAERRRLVVRFLDVADNLRRALAHIGADDSPPDALRAGVEATNRALQQMLDAEGVEEIEAMEAEFDPALHEAISVVAVPGLAGERVVAVERAGYRLGGTLLRAARVVVGRPSEG